MFLREHLQGHICSAYYKRLNQVIDLNLTNWKEIYPLFKNMWYKENSDK